MALESSRASRKPPPMGRPTSPFIDQGEGAGYMRERKRSKEEEGPGAVLSFFSYRLVSLVL
jgi:hypothetical protein